MQQNPRGWTPASPPTCSTSRLAPIVDSLPFLISASLLVRELNRNDRGDSDLAGPFIAVMTLLTIPWAISALGGFHSASRCGGAHERHYEFLADQVEHLVTAITTGDEEQRDDASDTLSTTLDSVRGLHLADSVEHIVDGMRGADVASRIELIGALRKVAARSEPARTALDERCRHDENARVRARACKRVLSDW